MDKHLKYRYIATVLLTLVLAGCSTQKNTFINRNYHNLTSYYNVYFNGNEALKLGLNKVETKMEEDYTKVLPIFKESKPGTETLIGTDMDRAIEKGEKLIKLHSITKPPKQKATTNSRKRKPIKEEYNMYVDDAYLLMGKASLYKKDYIRASSIFTQVIRKYKNEPAKYQAYLWLIRTFAESERYTEARELVETLEGDNKFPKELEGELAINAADLHLKQQHLDEAIQYLNIGIKKINGNKRKTRYTFILGQIYQETGKSDQALLAYKQVIRRRPNYTMLFNAQINSASVYSGKGNIAELRKELNRMSKKTRNRNYLDQIFYALGNLSLSEGKTDEAIRYYKNSASKSVKNTYQRALSCLTLGDIYLDQKKYIPSGSYYDSAMVIIDEFYPNYKTISEKYKNLSSLTSNLQTVIAQDSLQAMAKLSPDELDAKIDKWIVAAKMKMQDPESSGSTGDYNYAYSMNNRMALGNSGSTWYFYNPSTVSYGKKDFSRLWGDRKNEDFWRRSNKSISAGEETEEAEQGDLAENLKKEEKELETDPTKKEYYTQDIPKNDSLLAVSHMKIRDALFNAGTILKTEFNDLESALFYFRELQRRYPGNIYELPSYFSLWNIYSTKEKPDSTLFYKNEILSKFATSNYAKYLNNPNFFIEEEARRDSINKLYSLAFEAYKRNDLPNAAQYSNKVLAMKPDSALAIKAQFIKTLTESKGKDQTLMASNLSKYAETYPETETAKLATEIVGLVKSQKLDNYAEMINTGYLNEVVKNLEILQKNQSGNGNGQGTNSNQPEVVKWDKESEALHYFIIALPNNDSIDINRLKFDIANYNLDYYTTLDFDIETEVLNAENKLVIVRNFENKENAMIYFMSIMRKPYVFKTLSGQKFLNFVISNQNYREMLNDRSYNDYLSFFVKNYSTRTSIEIKDEDLETPEMLMARLKQDQNEVLGEKGGFVEVKTTDIAYTPPVQIEQMFKPNYNLPHSYMVVIDEARFKTGTLMREFVNYNNAEFRSSRLRVTIFNFKEKTALLVSSLPNGYDALAYLKKVDEKKKLQDILEGTSVNTFVITDENLTKLKETQDFGEWDKFYKVNYINRRPSAPIKEEEKKPVAVEETKPVSAPKKEEKKENTTVAQPDKQQPATKTDDKTAQKPDSQVIVDTKQPNVQTPIVESEKVVDYKGIYVDTPDSAHCLVYIVPSTGNSKTLLTTYLVRLNAMNYAALKLSISSETLIDSQTMVIISGLTNKTIAADYLKAVSTDNRVLMSLRNINYRSFLMSNGNLSRFKKSKDIQEYQKFYEFAY